MTKLVNNLLSVHLKVPAIDKKLVKKYALPKAIRARYDQINLKIYAWTTSLTASENPKQIGF